MGDDVANAILTPNGGRAGIGVGAALISPTLSARPSGGRGLGTDFDLDGGLVAFDPCQVTSKANRSNPQPGDPCHTLPATSSAPLLVDRWAVRRLMPVECERLQGFPDDYTNIPWQGKNYAPDGRRYKALGNSMAVNVMRWIGDRIAMVDAL